MTSSSHAQRVASNVRAEMARSGNTQSTLAPLVNMTQQRLSRRLLGRTPFTVEELGQVADALQVPLSELIGNERASA